jgi:hypothetical protein
MKIEIDIDIESIVREALKKKQEEETPKVWTEAVMKNSRSKWEYGRKNGRRRTIEEMALHDLERKKGRLLTPEEKGEAKAVIQIDTTTENTVKEAAIKKDRIDKIVAEGTAAASKELAEEIKERDDNITRVQEGMDKHDVEAEIPKTEKLDTNSLFT